MSSPVSPSYQGIKVNVITGFLGAGKTTLIKHLLTQVPEGENWAVLVNEFGEIGLDQDLIEADPLLGDFAASKARLDNIVIKQVAGGCVCCTTSTAFQVALNQLIKSHNPDRILIEPTGLGHPNNILKQLQTPYYQQVLLLEKTLCLLDARVLHDTRYTQHLKFLQQIAIADSLIVSKTELYEDKDFLALADFVNKQIPAEKPLIKIKQGELSVEHLYLSRIETKQARPSSSSEQLASQFLRPEHGQVALSSKMSGLDLDAGVKVGAVATEEIVADFKVNYIGEEVNLAWRFEKISRFDRAKLACCAKEIASLAGFLRLKGVFQIDEKHTLTLNVTPYDYQAQCIDLSAGGAKVEVIFEAQHFCDDMLTSCKGMFDSSMTKSRL